MKQQTVGKLGVARLVLTYSATKAANLDLLGNKKLLPAPTADSLVTILLLAHSECNPPQSVPAAPTCSFTNCPTLDGEEYFTL